jgi:hypothetical protein
MIFLGTLIACFVANGGRSAWFVGVLLLMVYLVFAMSLFLLPPLERSADGAPQEQHGRLDSCPPAVAPGLFGRLVRPPGTEAEAT